MRIITAIFLILSSITFGFGQVNNFSEPTVSRESNNFSLYTTWLSFANFGKPETNTQHYELQLAYHKTDKDRIGIKIATWKLFAPMGINIWDSSFLDEASYYPGRLRETGIGFTYQRKVGKKLFVALEIMPMETTYLSNNENEIGKGFKLYNSYHAGYHIPLFKNGKVFIEPQLHVNHWPINTNVPDSFKAQEDGWDNLFFIEPNIYIGIKF